MDLTSIYGRLTFMGAVFAWLLIVGAPLYGEKWRPGWALFSTIVLLLVAGVILGNERWGSGAKHRANCEHWRDRYDQATTLLDLERARDGLREGRCSVVEG